MSMGKNIAYLRKSKGYTQEELGQKIGVTNQAVSKWVLLLRPDLCECFLQ